MAFPGHGVTIVDSTTLSPIPVKTVTFSLVQHAAHDGDSGVSDGPRILPIAGTPLGVAAAKAARSMHRYRDRRAKSGESWFTFE